MLKHTEMQELRSRKRNAKKVLRKLERLERYEQKKRGENVNKKALDWGVEEILNLVVGIIVIILAFVLLGWWMWGWSTHSLAFFAAFLGLLNLLRR